jgi:subtilisin family serine protease
LPPWHPAPTIAGLSLVDFLQYLESTMSMSSFSVARWCMGLGLITALSGVGAAQAAERMVVTFKPGAQAAQSARAAIAQAGGRIKLELIGGHGVAAELSPAAIARLKRHPAVALVEEDAKRYPLALATPSKLPYYKGQLTPYGIKMVQANKVNGLDAYASNRRICIIDSGYSFGHADLPRNHVTGDDDIGGAGPWAEDGFGHGTHVAGTIAAVNRKGEGVVGVLPNKQINLHIVRVFGDSGTWAYSSTLANAAMKCQAAGANIISMSLGGGGQNANERQTFDNLRDAGMLSIAAAGNGGNTATSYPAGYESVMSVAAVDENMTQAAFSQRNADVEIAAPGVLVLSTVTPGSGTMGELEVDSQTYAPIPLDGSATESVSAKLADFGLGDKVNDKVDGKVCLIQRGEITFAEKVQNCVTSGGVGAVIYNNVPGSFVGTLNGNTSIPAVSVSDTEGAALVGQVGGTAMVAVEASDYAYFDGTSMATPHVSGVAALVWSQFPDCTGEQIRNSLNKSAMDLGDAGRDHLYGHGLVQAQAAYKRIKQEGCGN